jgi:glutamate-1-semialdehyde 2,1-aminomutase
MGTRAQNVTVNRRFLRRCSAFPWRQRRRYLRPNEVCRLVKRVSVQVRIPVGGPRSSMAEQFSDHPIELPIGLGTRWHRNDAEAGQILVPQERAVLIRHAFQCIDGALANAVQQTCSPCPQHKLRVTYQGRELVAFMKILKRGLGFSRLDGEELLFARGYGPYVFDDKGRRYADFVLGFGPVVLGHGRRDFNRLVADLLEGDLLFPGFSTLHTAFVDLLFGGDTDNLAVSFFKTSSEAVTAALRIAAIATGRKGVIRCGFLGWHDAQIANTPLWSEQPAKRRAPPERQFMYRGVSGDELALNWMDMKLESLASAIRENEAVIGAFAIDSYQLSFSDPATIHAAMELCRQKGIKVIFDETKTAGRVTEKGLWWDYRNSVDCVIAGKAIANGAPLSLLIIDDGETDLFYAAKIGGTYAKGRIAVAAALSTMQIMRQGGGYARLTAVGTVLVEAINLAARDEGADHLVHARTCFGGALFEIALTDEAERDPDARRLLRATLAENGILALIAHPCFTCLDHEQLDFDSLENDLRLAFRQWSKQIQSARGPGPL